MITICDMNNFRVWVLFLFRFSFFKYVHWEFGQMRKIGYLCWGRGKPPEDSIMVKRMSKKYTGNQQWVFNLAGFTNLGLSEMSFYWIWTNVWACAKPAFLSLTVSRVPVHIYNWVHQFRVGVEAIPLNKAWRDEYKVLYL